MGHFPIHRSHGLGIITLLAGGLLGTGLLAGADDAPPATATAPATQPETIDKLKKAIALLQAGQGTDALTLFNEVIVAEPKWDIPLIWRSQLWTAAGLPESAMKDINAAITLNPRNGDALHLRAALYLKEGMKSGKPNSQKLSYEHALTDVEAALKLNRAPQTAILRAQIYYVSGNTEKAEALYASFFKNLPEARAAEVKMMVANARFEVGDHAGGIKDLTALIEQLKDDPKSAELLVILAEMHAVAGSWQASSADLDASIKRIPKLADHPRVQAIRDKIASESAPALYPMAALARDWLAKPADAALRANLAKEVEARLHDRTYKYGFVNEETFGTQYFNTIFALYPGQDSAVELNARLKDKMDSIGANSLTKLDTAFYAACKTSWTDSAAARTAATAAAAKGSGNYEENRPESKEDVAAILEEADKLVDSAVLAESFELRARIRLDSADYAGAAADYSLALFAADLGARLGGPRDDSGMKELRAMVEIASRLRDKKDDEFDLAYCAGRKFEAAPDPASAFDSYTKVGRASEERSWAGSRLIFKLAVTKHDVIIRDSLSIARKAALETTPPNNAEALRFITYVDDLTTRMHEGGDSADERSMERVWALGLRADILASQMTTAEQEKEFLKQCDQVEQLAPFNASNHVRRAAYWEKKDNTKYAYFLYNAATVKDPTTAPERKAVATATAKRDALKKNLAVKDLNEALNIATMIKVDGVEKVNPNSNHPAGIIAACTDFMKVKENNQTALHRARGVQYESTREWDKAIEDLAEVIRLDPKINFGLALARAYQALGKHQETLDEIKRYEAIPKGEMLSMIADPSPNKIKFKSYLALKQFDKAEKELEYGVSASKGVLSNSNDPLEFNMLKGDLLLAKGDKPAALALWQSLLPETLLAKRVGEQVRTRIKAANEQK